MLSYQHAYHAGNQADVLKHAVLALLLARLAEKPALLTYLETHAGRGVYPVDGTEMQKLREYEQGIGRLLSARTKLMQALPPALIPYLSHYAQNPEDIVEIPGSPAVARLMLPQASRPNDVFHLSEKHPGEATHLKAWVHGLHQSGDRRLHVHVADGPATVPSLLPGNSGRAVVLIDPSYEIKDEYGSTSASVAAMLKVNPKAVIMVWYPMLDAGRHQRLASNLKALRVPATWRAEAAWQAPGKTRGMYGTGLVVLNLPFGLERPLDDTLDILAPMLASNPADLHLHSAFVVPPR